jgi:sterol desaturase/sphingolipid hydroxylase (fatty acid hydroxylase superfamily)
LGSLPVSLFTTGAVVYAYSFIYQFRIFTMPSTQWWVLLLLFLGDDFSYYWFHRLSHQVRFLWASHMVHHSSQKFTFTAALRVPWTSTLTGNFLFWAWMPLTGFEPYLVLFMKSVSVIYQFWMHTETINKLPEWFENIFNTPSHHRVHHAINVEYLDKNHAGTLIIWDKLFGTYQEETFKPTYGLTENIRSCNPFVIAFHGWKSMLRDFKKTTKIKDRFHYFFNAPGWSHNGNNQTTKQLQEYLKNQIIIHP